MKEFCLEECCEINPKVPKDLSGDILVSFVPMSAVSEIGELSLNESRRVDEVKKGFTYFEENDVLFAKITPCMENGKGALATNLTNKIGFGSTEFHVIRAKRFITPYWLFLLTKSENFRKLAEKSMTGSAGQKRVPTSFLEKFKINLPDIKEQIELENVFKCIFSLLHKYKRMIELCDILVKSRFVELVDSAELTVKNIELKFLTNKIGSGFTPKGGSSVYLNSGVSFIRSMNVYNNYFDTEGLAFIDTNTARSLDSVEVHEDDVLINITGASFARCCSVPANILPARVNQHVCILRSKKEIILPKFLEAVITSDVMQKELFRLGTSHGATRQALTKADLENLMIILPEIKYQKNCVDFKEKVDKSKFAIQQSIEKLETLKKSLMQEYFG